MAKINLRDIVTEEFQQEIQDSFAYATGFGVVFTDCDGSHIGDGSNFTRFCKRINNMSIGAHYCTLSNSQAIHIALETGKPCIYVCHAGMINIEIPLIYQGDYVGAITAGQVLCSEMDYYPKDPISCGVNWMESEDLAEYYKEIKVLSRQQIEATTIALRSICSYILQNTAYTQAQKELADNREALLEYEKQQISLKHQLKVAELNALQRQVTPHFIFNVINSVSRLISLEEYETAGHTLSAFAQMMRYSLSNVASTVTLQQELEYIKNYLSIQKIRFSDRLDYSIYCEQGMGSIYIPFFSLQPLVENSIEHGILRKSQGGALSIHCCRSTQGISIEIKDNGIGIEKALLEQIQLSLINENAQSLSKHIGLYNCYNRLKLLFDNQMEFHITSKKEHGTLIQIKIPHVRHP